MLLYATSLQPVPAPLREVLDDFAAEHPRRPVRLWMRTGEEWALAFPLSGAPETEPGAEAVEVPASDSGELWVEVLGGTPRERRFAAKLLASSLARVCRHEAEMRKISRELSERYEEITLLYSISETLGSLISLDDAAAAILAEVQSMLSADRAALWVHDPARDELVLVAAVGGDGQSGPIAVGDSDSVTAEVFRESHPVIYDPGDVFPRADKTHIWRHRGGLLSVPVSFTPPGGQSRTIGVINLVRRSSDTPFSAGDQKLLMAIASQVGAAVENNRLVRASLQQERLVRELELAHDLQLKLLPPIEAFPGVTEVAARCVPASSVGGDFYQLFRLPGGRLGVVIGDVSSHGFPAALIMALTMSAVAIHASEGDPPAEVLGRVHRALIGELESTEMYVTLFYGVLDPRGGRVTFANAGHPHAFRISRSGGAERLAATNPPLGIVDLDTYAEASVSWTSGEDLLFLFTDGLIRALPVGEREGELQLVEEIGQRRQMPLCELLARLFALTHPDGSPAPDDRTAMLLRC